MSKGRPEVFGITQGTEKLRSDLAHRLTKFPKNGALKSWICLNVQTSDLSGIPGGIFF